MSLAHVTLPACIALELAILGSLLFTGSWRISKLFAAYLLAVVLPDVLFLAVPATFTWPAWMAKEAFQCALKGALALELVALIFASLPRARQEAELALAVVFIGAATVLFYSPIDGTLRGSVKAFPVVNNATAIGIAIVLGIAIWYRVPMHPLHHAILNGLALYLVVFSFLMQGLEARGWSGFGRDVQGVAYASVLLYWLTAVWQREELPDTATLRELRPWA